MVRAVADELADVRTEDDARDRLGGAPRARERRGRPRTRRRMRAFMDLEAVRDAAFCHRHREITRARGKEIARERLEQAWREQAEWVVLFDDVTPLGSHRLEMHVRSGRGAARLLQARPRPAGDLLARGRPARSGHRARGCSTSRRSCRAQTYGTPDEWEARIAQARATFGKD